MNDNPTKDITSAAGTVTAPESKEKAAGTVAGATSTAKDTAHARPADLMQTSTSKSGDITDEDLEQARREAAQKQELEDAMKSLKAAQSRVKECQNQAKLADEAVASANANLDNEQTEFNTARKNEADAEKARREIEQELAIAQEAYCRLNLDYIKLNQSTSAQGNTQAQAATAEAIKALDSALAAVNAQQKTLSNLMSRLTEALTTERNLENVESEAIKELAAAKLKSYEAAKAAQDARMKAEAAHTDALKMQAIVAVADAKTKLQAFMKEETSSAQNFFYGCLFICFATTAWTFFNVRQTEQYAVQVGVQYNDIINTSKSIDHYHKLIIEIKNHIRDTSLDVNQKAAQATEALELIQKSREQLEVMQADIQRMEADLKQSMADMDEYNLTVLNNKISAAGDKLTAMTEEQARERAQAQSKLDNLLKALAEAKERFARSAAIVSTQEAMEADLQAVIAASTKTSGSETDASTTPTATTTAAMQESTIAGASALTTADALTQMQP
jgi:chromosome segregation ATPase